MTVTLSELIAEILKVPVHSVTDDTAPGNTPGWDSLATVNLIAALEERYAIQLSLDELMELTNVGAVRALLTARGIAG